MEIETDLLISRYRNVPLSTLKYYKVSQLMNQPERHKYIDTSFTSRSKSNIKMEFASNA